VDGHKSILVTGYRTYESLLAVIEQAF
jgi:hypothetical protein